MATIDVKRKHDRGRDAARAAAEKIAVKLDQKIGVTYRWNGDDLEFERTGASGKIRVSDDEVRVQIDLALVLRPMKAKIERRVHEYLDEVL